MSLQIFAKAVLQVEFPGKKRSKLDNNDISLSSDTRTRVIKANINICSNF